MMSESRDPRLPNFLYIGPDKAGSTWLYEFLRSHPQAYVTECKDTYFFDRYFSRGWGWYLDFFRDVRPDHLAMGEVCHDYLFSEQACERIAHGLPGVRPITAVRDPVDRAFSQYLYLLRSGLAGGDFESCCEQFPRLLDNSRYAVHLPRWVDAFGDRLLVLCFDDLVDEPQQFAGRITSHLGIAQMRTLPGPQREAGVARSRFLARLAKAAAHGFRELGMPEVVGRAKHGPLGRLLFRGFRAGEKPALPAALRARLVEEFSADIAYVERLLGRSLESWRRVDEH
jgi:hypothetical protein